jgi:hypothetical protein
MFFMADFTGELGKLNQGVNYETYAGTLGLRASDLKQLKRSPAHYVTANQREQEDKEHFEFGKVFHAMVENGESFLDNYVVEPVFTGKTLDGRDSTRSRAAKDARDAWYLDLKTGSVVVKERWVEPLVGMCRAIKAHRLVGNLVKEGVRETSLWVTDPETGVTLKCRPDFISSAGFLVDFKSTRNAHPDEFYWDIFGVRGYFYSMQLAHYNHCLRAAGISRGESATIVAVEKEAPYGVMVYPLDVGNLGPGEQWRAHLTRLYAECLRTNQWPGYPEQAQALDTPENIKLPPDVGA